MRTKGGYVLHRASDPRRMLMDLCKPLPPPYDLSGFEAAALCVSGDRGVACEALLIANEMRLIMHGVASRLL